MSSASGPRDLIACHYAVISTITIGQQNFLLTSQKIFRPVAPRFNVKSKTLYGLVSSPTYTRIRADLVLPTLSIGMIVSSVATTCDCRTRSPINSYKGAQPGQLRRHPRSTASLARSQSPDVRKCLPADTASGNPKTCW